MPGEFSDLENFSDLDNLLAMAEEEFNVSEAKDPVEVAEVAVENDCEFISIKTIETKPQSLSAIKSILNTGVSKVQKSISDFFKAPKRFPDEVYVSAGAGAADGGGDVSEVKKTKTMSLVFPKAQYKLPKFKLIPGTPFSVDAFSYGQIPSISGYFLTHFHSDHYKGLTNKLFDTSGMRLYCSEVTGNLVQKELKVRGEVITTLKIGNIYLIEGIHVGVLDANQYIYFFILLVT